MPAELVLYPGAPVENFGRLVSAYQQMLRSGGIQPDAMLRWTVDLPRRDRPLFVWVLTHDGEPVGEVSLSNATRIRAEVGIVLTDKCPKWLGASTFLNACHTAYSQLGIAKLEGYVRVSNAHAVKLAKRFGFKQEGVLRSAAPTVKGKLEDVVVFGLLKDEFYRKWGGRSGRRGPDLSGIPSSDGIRGLPAVQDREAGRGVLRAVGAGNGDQSRGGQAVQ